MGRLPGSRPLSTIAETPPLSPEDAPRFREPWQAKAFALVLLLHRQGYFTWEAWVRGLATEIANTPQQAGEDADQAYHRQVLVALERLVAEHGLADQETVAARAEAWRRAYLNTPHGHPVDLAAAERADARHEDGEGHRHFHDHALAPHPSPVAVAKASSR